jgi:hypothetical protein
VGNIGSTALRSFNAMGDAVNVAARLESIAQPGQVVIGESTRALLPDDAAVESLGELAVKGRRSGVVAYRLFGCTGPTCRTRRGARVCRTYRFAPVAGLLRGRTPTRLSAMSSARDSVRRPAATARVPGCAVGRVRRGPPRAPPVAADPLPAPAR